MGKDQDRGAFRHVRNRAPPPTHSISVPLSLGTPTATTDRDGDSAAYPRPAPQITVGAHAGACGDLSVRGFWHGVVVVFVLMHCRFPQALAAIASPATSTPTNSVAIQNIASTVVMWPDLRRLPAGLRT